MALLCLATPIFRWALQADGYLSGLERLCGASEKNWRKLIRPEDTIVLAGDISWAMRLTDPPGLCLPAEPAGAEDHEGQP